MNIATSYIFYNYWKEDIITQSMHIYQKQQDIGIVTGKIVKIIWKSPSKLHKNVFLTLEII